MHAGSLDRRVTIETPTSTRGETGGHEESWAVLEMLWANVRDLSGRETFNAQAAGSKVSKVVTLRWRSDITPDMRVRFADGTTARISWVRELVRAQWIEIYCEKVE